MTNDLIERAVSDMPVGLILYNSEGEVCFFNPAAESVLNRRITLGQEIEDLIGSNPFRPMSSELEVRLTNLSQGILRRLGTEAEDAQFGLYLIGHELFREYRHNLRMNSLGHLLPTLAHELKNPLAGIQSTVEVLLGNCSPTQTEDLKILLEEIDRMRYVIDSLGLATGDIRLRGKSSNITPTLTRIIRLFQRQADHQGIQIRHNFDEKVVAPINTHTLRIVLGNLIKNSLEACKSGDQIIVNFIEDDTHFTLRVQDTGCGMSEDVGSQAATLFYTTKPGGSGIGLALIAELAKRESATLKIKTRLGFGTAIDLLLPKEAS